MHARVLRYLSIARLDPQGIRVVVKRERQRMKEAIVGFGDPLADWIMREMAVVTDRNVVMAGFLPGIVRLLHHMTVDAGLGIVAEITRPFTVAKGERSEAKNHSQEDRKERRKQSGVYLSFCIPIA